MSIALMIIFILCILFVLLLSGQYIGFALIGTGIFGFEFLAHRGDWVGATLYNPMNSFVITAILFFIFMGEIILHSGISDRLFRGISKWARIIPGRLIHANILASAVFAAVCGSSPATAATVGSVAYFNEKKRGYKDSLVTGSLAAGGTLGILIPPSINLIIYGAFVGLSVGRLFAAGIVPGIIVAFTFMLAVVILCVRNKTLAPRPEKIKLSLYLWEAIIALKDIWSLFFIIVVIWVSIYRGIMTPTEAAAVSCLLSMVFGIFLGKLNLNILKDAALRTLSITGMTCLIYSGANLMGNALSLLRIPAQLAKLVVALGLSSLEIWFLVVLLYLILGCFMDSLAMVLVTLPVTYPLVVYTAGFDPIWFGIQLVLLCEIGMITPPIGLNIFVMQAITKGEVSQSTIVRGIFPFFLILLFFVIFFTFFPEIVLFLPKYLFI